jgi:hypothetical protein
MINIGDTVLVIGNDFCYPNAKYMINKIGYIHSEKHSVHDKNRLMLIDFEICVRDEYSDIVSHSADNRLDKRTGYWLHEDVLKVIKKRGEESVIL